MALLDQRQREYYEGREFGGYQFTSLDDIINYFMVAYIGEDKIIGKAKRSEVAFHAQRAMQELSFDTFKSCKSQEILLPNSLTMVLPHDYVNYTKISSVDSSGIKHRLYPHTCTTSNPFSISQQPDGKYSFNPGIDFGFNTNFDEGDEGLEDWVVQGNTIPNGNPPRIGSGRMTQSERTTITNPINILANNTGRSRFEDTITAATGVLTFNHHNSDFSATTFSNIHVCYQEVDLDGVTLLNISARGSSAKATENLSVLETSQARIVHEGGVLRFGISANKPDEFVKGNKAGGGVSTNDSPSLFDRGYLEWSDGEGTESNQELTDLDSIDVSDLSVGYIIIVSFVPFQNKPENDAAHVNTIDNISIIADASVGQLQSNPKSTTWSNYSSHNPSENNINDYQDYQNHGYWPHEGERYGLEPQHSQANGSFYIDCAIGKIHFSSNIGGKTIILDYISDGLGTDKEMQVHKFAEEAMYKWIMHAILSTKKNIPEYQVARYKKERFAAIRQAKLRLSNIKLEEITQIFRGKSKQIKH